MNKLEKLLAALEDIKEFGKKNPGCGFSCSRKAEMALSAYKEETEVNPVKES